jgi:hypothetical protein
MIEKPWRLWSVQIFAVIAALPVVWAELPPDIKAMIPDGWSPYIVTLIAIGGIVARSIPQSKPDDPA